MHSKTERTPQYSPLEVFVDNVVHDKALLSRAITPEMMLDFINNPERYKEIFDTLRQVTLQSGTFVDEFRPKGNLYPADANYQNQYKRTPTPPRSEALISSYCRPEDVQLGLELFRKLVTILGLKDNLHRVGSKLDHNTGVGFEPSGNFKKLAQLVGRVLEQDKERLIRNRLDRKASIAEHDAAQEISAGNNVRPDISRIDRLFSRLSTDSIYRTPNMQALEPPKLKNRPEDANPLEPVWLTPVVKDFIAKFITLNPNNQEQMVRTFAIPPSNMQSEWVKVYRDKMTSIEILLLSLLTEPNKNPTSDHPLRALFLALLTKEPSINRAAFFKETEQALHEFREAASRGMSDSDLHSLQISIIDEDSSPPLFNNSQELLRELWLAFDKSNDRTGRRSFGVAEAILNYYYLLTSKANGSLTRKQGEFSQQEYNDIAQLLKQLMHFACELLKPELGKKIDLQNAFR